METIKKYIKEIIIGGLVLLLLLLGKCSNDNQNVLQGERNLLKRQLSENKKVIIAFKERQKIFFDSIDEQEKIKDNRIKELHTSNKDLALKLDRSKQALEKTKEGYRNKSYAQLAQVFTDQGYTQVTSDTSSVKLCGDSPLAVLDDLAEGNNCFEDLSTLNATIKNKNEEIKLFNEKVVGRDLKIESYVKEIEKKDLSIKLSEELNLKSDKQIRSLKTSNFLTKLFVPAAAIGGFLLSNQLRK